MPRNFIRAILFDFGGTLMYGRQDWTPIIAKADEALTNYLRSQGMEINLNTFPTEFRKRLDEYFKQREQDLLETTYTFVLRELLREKGYDDVPPVILRRALDTLFSVTQTNWTLEEDAIPALQQLHSLGYRMGIISNAGDDEDVQQLARRFGITDYFDFILTSAACSYRKPHPRIFELALSHWYCPPNEAVMVGDNLDADIRGAQQAGIYGVWISRRASPEMEKQEQVQPDASLSTLLELPAILDRLQIQ
ncbi:MAG: HAD family hydrolase [Chloroflexota bacterium]|nr:HAD family hydrolase [Chloroflexota bacterium]MBI5704332.1 HAD family hydrolase [Chloroflexota bacterium]